MLLKIYNQELFKCFPTVPLSMYHNSVCTKYHYHGNNLSTNTSWSYHGNVCYYDNIITTSINYQYLTKYDSTLQWRQCHIFTSQGLHCNIKHVHMYIQNVDKLLNKSLYVWTSTVCFVLVHCVCVCVCVCVCMCACVCACVRVCV